MKYLNKKIIFRFLLCNIFLFSCQTVNTIESSSRSELSEQEKYLTISGLITNAKTKEVIPNANIRVGNSVTKSDNGGFYEIEKKPEINTRVVVSKENFETFTKDIPLQNQTLDIALNPVTESNVSTIPSLLSEKINSQVESVIESLLALTSKLSIGLNYRDFGNEVANIKVLVDRLNRVEEAQSHPSYSTINSAMREYEFSHDIWKCYFTFDGTYSFSDYNKCYGSKLERDYEVKIDVIGKKVYYYPTALDKVWSVARKMVEESKQRLENPHFNDNATTKPDESFPPSPSTELENTNPNSNSPASNNYELIRIWGRSFRKANFLSVTGATVSAEYFCSNNPKAYPEYNFKGTSSLYDGTIDILAPKNFKIIITVQKDGFITQKKDFVVREDGLYYFGGYIKYNDNKTITEVKEPKSALYEIGDKSAPPLATFDRNCDVKPE